MHPICSGSLRPKVIAIVLIVAADVGYKMLGDDAGGVGLANQDPLFDQEMEQPRLRIVFCGHLSKL